jgi:hypothetical protein
MITDHPQNQTTTGAGEPMAAAKPPVWRRPFCQTHASALSKARGEALRRFGQCHVCGETCDGLHSFAGAPLLCDSCCPLCTVPQRETTALSGFEVR